MTSKKCFSCDNYKDAFGRCPGVDIETVPQCYQPLENHPGQVDPDTGDLKIPNGEDND